MSSRQRAYAVQSINLAGCALIIASFFCQWTRNKQFIQAVDESFPGGWLLLVIAAFASIGSTIFYFFREKRKLQWFAVQIIATSIVIYIFLVVTAFYAGLFNQLEIGYFLCGLGLVLCVFEIIVFIVFHPSFEPAPNNSKQQAIEAAAVDLEKKFYEALDHEIRRKILRMIGENGYGTFTEFKAALDIGTGTLYHHLNTLSTLIYQKDDKKYYLTKLGEMTLQFMQDNVSYLGAIKEKDMHGKEARKIKEYLAWLDSRLLFSKIFEGTSRFKRYLLFLPITMYIAGALLGFQNYFYFFAAYSFYGTDTLFTPMLQLPAFIMLGIVSWFVMWGLIEGLCYVNFKKKADFSVSLAGCGLCSLPIFCFEVVM
nr:winged helix-turn-helix domain-containing protein [Candidatus Sigynarchaeota archaeon]